MIFFRGSSGSAEVKDHGAVATSNDAASGQILTGGDLKFTVEQGGNGSLPSYQEVNGAPVETASPLGYSVGPVTIVFMNISKMVGTGVYSTRMSSPFLLCFLHVSLSVPRQLG